MRDDLLDAQAAIDWAKSDFPNLAKRIRDWEYDTPCRIARDVDSIPGKHLFRLRDVKPIPRVINAEAGAIIHSIRSSLDLLAIALAERNGHMAPKDVYFPVARDEAHFTTGKHAARKDIRRLCSADQITIWNLKPWNGGNDFLFQLHNLDMTRKHRRLLSAFAAPNRIIVIPPAQACGLQFVPMWPGFKENAVIAEIPAGAPQGDFHMAVEVRLAEPGMASTRPVIEVLDDFARLASSIIALFGSA